MTVFYLFWFRVTPQSISCFDEFRTKRSCRSYFLRNKRF